MELPSISAPLSAPDSDEDAALRLTLAGGPIPSARSGPDPNSYAARWTAIGWDTGVLLAVTITAFIMLGAFWKPLAIISACYFLGGILLCGNSPGVFLFMKQPRSRVRPTADVIPMSPAPARDFELPVLDDDADTIPLTTGGPYGPVSNDHTRARA